MKKQMTISPGDKQTLIYQLAKKIHQTNPQADIYKAIQHLVSCIQHSFTAMGNIRRWILFSYHRELPDTQGVISSLYPYGLPGERYLIMHLNPEIRLYDLAHILASYSAIANNPVLRRLFTTNTLNNARIIPISTYYSIQSLRHHIEFIKNVTKDITRTIKETTNYLYDQARIIVSNSSPTTLALLSTKLKLAGLSSKAEEARPILQLQHTTDHPYITTYLTPSTEYNERHHLQLQGYVLTDLPTLHPETQIKTLTKKYQQDNTFTAYPTYHTSLSLHASIAQILPELENYIQSRRTMIPDPVNRTIKHHIDTHTAEINTSISLLQNKINQQNENPYF